MIVGFDLNVPRIVVKMMQAENKYVLTGSRYFFEFRDPHTDWDFFAGTDDIHDFLHLVRECGLQSRTVIHWKKREFDLNAFLRDKNQDSWTDFLALKRHARVPVQLATNVKNPYGTNDAVLVLRIFRDPFDTTSMAAEAQPHFLDIQFVTNVTKKEKIQAVLKDFGMMVADNKCRNTTMWTFAYACAEWESLK